MHPLIAGHDLGEFSELESECAVLTLAGLLHDLCRVLFSLEEGLYALGRVGCLCVRRRCASFREQRNEIPLRF